VSIKDYRLGVYQYFQFVVRLNADSSNLEVFSCIILRKDFARTFLESIHEYAGPAEHDGFNGLHLIRIASRVTSSGAIKSNLISPAYDEQAAKTAFGYRVEK
jgi:hypothetical protein